MYVQHCVKGVAGKTGGTPGISEDDARGVICRERGIWSNWLREQGGCVSPASIRDQLTEGNLDRHLHDYKNYGARSPFISLACGAVERQTWLRRNFAYSAVDTALMFATENWARAGALFYLWVPTGHNAVVPLASVAEPVRDLNIYRRWLPYQVEGEVTAKIHIAANQIERVEWWDGEHCTSSPKWTLENPEYVTPERVSNIRELF